MSNHQPTQAPSIPTTDALAAGLLAPKVVVRGYRIERVLRAGQSNNVYIATAPDNVTTVALKEYFPRRFANRLPTGRIGVISDGLKRPFEVGVKGFVSEAVALAEIRSDLLAKYVAAFRENGTAYLVTAMVPGETLEDYARRVIRAKEPGREYPLEEDLRRIFGSLLDAVQVMHDRGYLHLDIKPSNVIMRDGFTPVLIDLGGARKFPFDPKRHVVSASNYTPGFAAPEQHLEKSAELCVATDIYGAGASILYCMSGKIPPLGSERLKNDTLEELLARCTSHYSHALINIVRRCMAVRIKDRCQSVQETQALLVSNH